MFDFNKPKIQITEMSDDKRYGKFVVEPLERGIWYYTGQLFKKNYAFFFTGCRCKPGEN